MLADTVGTSTYLLRPPILRIYFLFLPLKGNEALLYSVLEGKHCWWKYRHTHNVDLVNFIAKRDVRLVTAPQSFAIKALCGTATVTDECVAYNHVHETFERLAYTTTESLMTKDVCVCACVYVSVCVCGLRGRCIVASVVQNTWASTVQTEGYWIFWGNFCLSTFITNFIHVLYKKLSADT